MTKDGFEANDRIHINAFTETTKGMAQTMKLARSALTDWKDWPVAERLKVLGRLRRLLVRDMQLWIDVLQQEAHKTPMDTLTTDLMTTASAIAYYEKHAKRMLRARKVSNTLLYLGAKSYYIYEPYGVVAVIAPWNFPLQLSLVPAITALAAGNTVILKPSDKVPQTNALLDRMLLEAGFPAGVIQVVQGSISTVEALIDACPNYIFFTGGIAAGRSVLKRAANYGIPCGMELSGKDAMIVCADAHIERAARAAVWGGFTHSGQVCVGVERIYVQEDVYRTFVDAVVLHLKQLVQSATGWADIGGMTVDDGWHRVKLQLEDAIAKGATIEAGGLLTGAVPPLFPPTVLTGVTAEMLVMREEIFGPLLPILTYRDEAEAVAMANDSIYGLSASIFTRDILRGEKLARQLETGSCAINDVVRHVGNMSLPFGGVKASGFGRSHGEEGLLAFCRTKSITASSGRRSGEINWFPYKQESFEWLLKGMRWMYGRGGKQVWRRP